MAAKGYGEKVLGVLLDNRNQTVTAAEIMKATGLEITQVQNTVSNLRNAKKDLYDIAIVLRGRAWRLVDRAEVDSGRRMFEEVGTAKDGRIVIQDTDGTLYIAIAM